MNIEDRRKQVGRCSRVSCVSRRVLTRMRKLLEVNGITKIKSWSRITIRKQSRRKCEIKLCSTSNVET